MRNTLSSFPFHHYFTNLLDLSPPKYKVPERPLPTANLSFLLLRTRTYLIMSQKRKAAADLAASDAKKPKANASITSFFQAPKAASASKVNSKTLTPGTVATASRSPTSTTKVTTPEPSTRVPFDIEAWAKKLNDEQKDLLGLEIATLHESWFKELKDDLLSKEFLDLKRFLKKEHEAKKQIFPPAGDVYSWFVFLLSLHIFNSSCSNWVFLRVLIPVLLGF